MVKQYLKNTGLRKMLTAITLLFFIGSLLSGCDSMDLSTHSDLSETDAEQTAAEEPYVIAIENLTLANTYADTNEVEDAVNAIIMPMINCKIDIVNYHIADHANKVALAVAGGAKIDLINTGLTTTLSGYVADQVVIGLDDLLKEYAPHLSQKVSTIIKATTINKKIYAIPGNLYPGKSIGVGFNKSLLDTYDLKIPKIVNMDVLTAMGKVLKASGDDVYLSNDADGSLSLFDVFYFSEVFDVNYSQGVIFNPLVNTKIINVYASESYLEYCKTIRMWYEKGYIPEDSITAGRTGQQTFNAGNILFQMMNFSPLGEQIAIKKGLPFEEVLVSTTPNVISQSSVQEYAWGITSTCKRPDKVMQFLELLYNNAEISNLMTHGIEGKHYIKVSEHILKYPDGINGDNVGYGRIFSMYGDMMQQYQFEPATESFYSDLESFYSRSKPLLTFGYSFDTDEVSSELAAVQDIVTEFRPLLECGVTDDVEETLRIFNEELKKAGIDRIIAENQRQLDAWLAETKN